MNNEEARESQRAWEPARQAMARSRRQLAATKRAAGANPKARKSAGQGMGKKAPSEPKRESNEKEEGRKEKIDAGRGARERRREKKKSPTRDASRRRRFGAEK